MKTPSNDTLRLRFNVLVEGQPDGNFMAHCLELDLVAEGNTLEQACSEIMNVIDVHVRTCIENDNMEHLFFPAPKEVWERLGAIQAKMSRCTRDTITHTVPDSHQHKFRKVEVDQLCYA
ncbi:MAG: hypothetical protein Q7N50_07840 [Armatimonadota bacterium]|nr:hypothetical protein [Armatimonadota bacterium]